MVLPLKDDYYGLSEDVVTYLDKACYSIVNNIKGLEYFSKQGKELAVINDYDLITLANTKQLDLIVYGYTYKVEEPFKYAPLSGESMTRSEIESAGRALRGKQDDFLQALNTGLSQLNKQENVNGILVQLPLPKHINEQIILDSIDPDKDADGFHPLNVGKLSVASHNHENLLIPCTPYGCLLMLKGLGIEPVHPLNGVGENLRDHYAPRFNGRVKNTETINERSKGIKLVGEVIKYLIGAKSIINLSPSMVYGFWHTNPAIQSNDVQFIFTPASYKLGAHGILDDYPGFTVAAWQHRPESKGWVRARSDDPFEKPIIQPNYLAEEEDRRVTVGAMKLARKLMHTEAMKPYFDFEEYPGDQVQTDEDLIEAGVIDPTKVVRTALENAASIASMLLTTECVIVDKVDENAAAPAMPPMGGGMPGMM